MALHSTRSDRERILIMGPWGSGKTYSALKIAQMLNKTGSDARMFVIDTDYAMDRMLADPEFEHLRGTTVLVEVAEDWESYLSALEMFTNKMTTEDWLVVDMLGPAWDYVQEYFVEKVFAKGIDEFFLMARKQNEKGSALDGFKDWTIINKLYRRSSKFLVKCPGHLLCTSMVEAVNADLHDRETRMMFGAYGVKPKAQKHSAHLFHTILLASVKKPGDWRLTTVKDRGRAALDQAVVRDFAMGYLVGRAGWRP